MNPDELERRHTMHRTMQAEHNARERRRTEWAEHLNLTESGTRCRGLHWLKTGRCHASSCQPLGFMDHTTQWNRDGRPALVLTQPYPTVGLEDALAELRADPELRVVVQDPSPWYGNGTVGVLIWRADAYRIALPTSKP